MKKEEHAGLSNEERVLLTLVDEGSNKGIWIKNLRDNSGLSQIQVISTFRCDSVVLKCVGLWVV